MRFYDGAGTRQHIYGPRRTDNATAEADLKAMRGAAAVFGEDREGGLKAMRAEARRIQERVTYEKEIRLAMIRRGPSSIYNIRPCHAVGTKGGIFLGLVRSR